MCVVSNIGDIGRKMWPEYPESAIWPPNLDPGFVPKPGTIQFVPAPYNGPTKGQFEEFLELLRAAHKFDVATGQADCPQEAKVGWIREMAKTLGVSDDKLKEIFA